MTTPSEANRGAGYAGAGSLSPADDSEQVLLARLRRGDDDAFAIVVRDQGRQMLATARRLLGNEEDAREALQEAFVAVFRSIASFAGNARLATWMHRVVVNTALMKLRRRRCRPECALEDLLPRFSEDGHHLEPPCPRSGRPELDLQREENRTIVRNAIDQLPATYREVVLLRDIEELSTGEVSEVLGITANAVKIRLHRARQALRTLLERTFEDRLP